MFVGKIRNKKETGRLIKDLSSVFPLGNHLKRVRWTSQKDIFEILLRPVRENDSPGENSLISVLRQTDIDTTGLDEHVTIYEIPVEAPSTSVQHREAMKYWPVQFREDKYMEKVLNDQLFTQEERSDVAKYLQMSLDAAQHGDEKVGCVIVDPTTSTVVAISHDRRHHHPLQHAVMVATDLVASSQGGGSWSIDSDHVFHSPFCEEAAEARISELKTLRPEKDAKKMCLPYLCTGYDAYISREPCIMCAMALVHSRIRRVFYSSSVSWGALGSHGKLHLQEGLNHRYQVWKAEIQNT